MPNTHVPQTPSPTAQQLDPRFADTVFVVEADLFKHRVLMNTWKDRVAWEEDNYGCFAVVGKAFRHDIAVQFWWAKLDGHRVLFYEPTSQVVDHRTIDAWLKTNCNPQWDGGSRRAHCDATNFHLCVQAIKALSRSAGARR
jgi:hypothetical protein